MLSLRLLTNVQEEGEKHKSLMVVHMRGSLKRRAKRRLAQKNASRTDQALTLKPLITTV
jgi:hypothetical protein